MLLQQQLTTEPQIMVRGLLYTKLVIYQIIFKSIEINFETQNPFLSPCEVHIKAAAPCACQDAVIKGWVLESLEAPI